jgi:phosphate acetyltransferase
VIDALYIATIDRYSGKSLVSLGVAELLLRRTNRLGIFRPVIDARPGEERDKNIDLLLRHFDLHLDYEETYGMTSREADELLSQDRYTHIMDTIIARYKALEERCDFILCIGSDLTSAATALEFDFNGDVAKNLGAPVLLVASGVDRDVGTIINSAHSTINAYQALGAQVVGMVVNRVALDDLEDLRGALKEELKDEGVTVAVIPAHEALASPTLREVIEQLHGEILFGGDHLDTLALNYLVIAMQLDNYLSHLTENALLITPGDRSDVILSALQAHQSNRYPNVAGIVLTGGFKPAPPIARLLEGLPDRVPIVSVRTNTYDTATRVSNIRSYITADNRPKIDLSLELFEEFVDTTDLESRLSSIQTRGMTPRMFLYNIVQKAKAQKQHIVLPEGDDERILRAAEVLLARDIVDLTILGRPREVRGLVQELGLQIDLDRTPIIWPEDSRQFDSYAETLLELRRHKGMVLDAARDLMRDVSYYGTMMVYKGAADGMVSGAAHTTQHTILPALQFIKAKPGFSVVSSVFFMCLDDQVLVYGDCAVNPNPTAEQLAEIALSSADTAQTFGIEPRIAMLSYSTGESGVGEDVERVRQATRIARERRPDLKLVGPIQYDAAVDPSVAAIKIPGSDVAGQATVFIFPDLNTGNNTYKAVQRETGAIAIGPVLQGLRKPINDLSRGATVEDVINTVAITAIQAQNS